MNLQESSKKQAKYSFNHKTHLECLNPVENDPHLRGRLCLHLLQSGLLSLQPVLQPGQLIVQLGCGLQQLMQQMSSLLRPLTDVLPPLTQRCQLVLHH